MSLPTAPSLPNSTYLKNRATVQNKRFSTFRPDLVKIKNKLFDIDTPKLSTVWL